MYIFFDPKVMLLAGLIIRLLVTPQLGVGIAKGLVAGLGSILFLIGAIRICSKWRAGKILVSIGVLLALSGFVMDSVLGELQEIGKGIGGVGILLVFIALLATLMRNLFKRFNLNN